ncbi:MAG: histidine phosphotransferase family protein [Pseudomonadota bacterium]
MTREFSAQLAARICHDFANPLGAIGNGLELMELSGGPVGPEMALIQDSLTQAKGQLRMLRLAFGPCADTNDTNAQTTAVLVDTVNAVGRVKLHAEPSLKLGSHDSQIAALALMCLENALPLGGTAQVHRTPTSLGILAEGRKVTHDPGIWAWVTDTAIDEPQLPSSRLQFPALGAAIANRGWQADITTSDSDITLAFGP